MLFKSFHRGVRGGTRRSANIVTNAFMWLVATNGDIEYMGRRPACESQKAKAGP